MHLHLKKINPLLFVVSAACILLVGFYLDTNLSQHASREVLTVQKRIEEQSLKIENTLEKIKDQNGRVDWSEIQKPVFLVHNDEIVGWGKTDFTPVLNSGYAEGNYVLIKNNAGDFIYKRTSLDSSRYLLAVIPLLRKYPITNQYLSSTWNEDVFGNINGRIESVTSNNGEVVQLNGKPLFRFVFTDFRNTFSAFRIFTLNTIGLVLAIIGFVIWLSKLHKRSKFQWVFICSGLGFISIRFFMIWMEYPLRWISSSVFDPQIFASSSFNVSIADLLLNSLGLLFLCLYLFFYYPKFRLVKSVLSVRKNIYKELYAVVIFTGAYFVLVYPFLFVEVIFHNSEISLDITDSLAIDWSRILSWLAIIVGTVSSFLVVHVFIRLVKRLVINSWKLILLNLFAGLIFLLYFHLAERDYWITLAVAFTLFSLLIGFNLTNTISHIHFESFVYFFVMLAAYGVQYGLSIGLFMEERQVEINKKYTTAFISGRDILGEYLLQSASRNISNDNYIQNSFTNPFVNRSLIKQKIKQVYLNTYFDRYDINSYLYSNSEISTDSITNKIFNSLLGLNFNENYRTEYPGLFFIEPSESDIGKRYVITIPINKLNISSGYVVIDLQLKRIIPENVYPELLVDNRFSQSYEATNSSLAIIRNGSIFSSYGGYNYREDFNEELLNDQNLYKEGVKTKDAIHFAVSEKDSSIIVISLSRYSIFNLLTNFSLFYVLGITVIALTLLIMFLVSVNTHIELNYAARIQLIIFLLFSLPLMIAAITTLNRVSESDKDQLTIDYRNKTERLGEEISSLLLDFLTGNMSRNDFSAEVTERAKQSNVDINVYSKNGKHLTTSQPLIFENQLASTLLDPSILKQFNSDGVNSIINTDNIGKLQFNTCYLKIIKGDSDDMLGVLSIPFFNSEKSLEATKINVLSNFLTIFTIIFILFSVLSFYIINWLTFPLRYITSALEKTSLTSVNRPLQWNSNDEIGLMVNEYNKMVVNLEQSKIELARNQKEIAWREIARQVAHEIKNPLTPMKLTLQQMEYQMIQNNLDSDKLKKAITSLLAQIEILNDIASSFSTFARMPAPIMQRVELSKILKDSVNLYASSENGSVSFDKNTEQVYVMGDEQLLSRIFSNLILNALQSGHGEKVNVIVSLKIMDKFVVITVTDNGAGISVEMADRIFLPYFSTKKSGSGLGLAISKQGIEQSGGEIWFESQTGKGTTFFVKLPLT